jgi:tricorn protease-like protein
MKPRHILGALVLLSTGLCSLDWAQPPGTAVPLKRSLTIATWLAAPIAAPAPAATPPAGKPAAPAPTSAPAPPAPPPTPGPDCVVACGMALPLSGVAFSPDGKTVAVGGFREVLVWDLVEGKLAKRIGVGQIGTMVQSVVFTKDGKSLAAAEGTSYGAGAVKVFDLQTGQLAMNFQEPKGVVYSLALSPDGKILVAGCSDAATYVWSLEEKKLVTTLKDHTLAVVSVSFAGDNKGLYLATASLDKTIQVWDAATWKAGRSKTTAEAPVHHCVIRSLRGNPNDRSFLFGLAVGGHDSRTLQIHLDDKAPAWARHDVKTEMDTGMPLDCLWIKEIGRAHV